MGPLRVDPIAAREVAAAHVELPRLGGAVARARYAQLVRESDRLFRVVCETDSPDRVRVCFTNCPTPYGDASELITSVRRHRVLEVTTAGRERDRVHPLMGCEVGGAYDRFRAVHDVLGHGLLRVGFDRQGEFAAWRFQERLHSRLAPARAGHRVARRAQRPLDDGRSSRAQGGAARRGAVAEIANRATGFASRTTAARRHWLNADGPNAGERGRR